MARNKAVDNQGHEAHGAELGTTQIQMSTRRIIEVFNDLHARLQVIEYRRGRIASSLRHAT